MKKLNISYNSKYEISNLILRQMIGFMGILLPIIGGLSSYFGGGFNYIPSISHTHYMNSYLAFEGLVMTTGLFLICYRGSNLAENIIASISGLGALGLSFFPADFYPLNPIDFSYLNTHNLFALPQNITGPIHFSCAGIFFVLITVLTFLFIINEITWKKITFIVCGVIMVISLIIVILFNFGIDFKWGPFGIVYVGEAFALWAFGVAWVVKGFNFKK